jgi:hypothetical protein
MGFHTIAASGVRYGLMAFDANGVERSEGAGPFSQTLIAEARNAVTDIFFFSHGWQGDLTAAIRQYDLWIGALANSPDLETARRKTPAFLPLFIGLHWPSLPWGNEDAGADGSFAAAARPDPQQMLNACIDRFGDGPEIRAALQTIFDQARYNITPDTLPPAVQQAYLDLNAALGLGSGGVSAPPDADREGFDPEDSYEAGNEAVVDFADFSLGGVLGPLRPLSYWTMKKRARSIGEGGMHDFLVALQNATPQTTRIHLMGHSFGAIVISGMLAGPNAQGALARPVDSVALVQGAVSLWCYAAKIPFAGAGPGYFSRILPDGKIAGPLVTTRSRFDKAVGQFYPLASRLGGSASFAPGLPQFGAIGAYGIRGLDKAQYCDAPMLPANGAYGFEPKKVYNLEASDYICHGAGASGAHSDIAGPEVAHAIWEAALVSVR